MLMNFPDNEAYEHGVDQGIFLQQQNGSLYKGNILHRLMRRLR